MFSLWNEFLQQSFLGNTYLQLISAGVVLVALAIFIVVFRFIFKRLAQRYEKGSLAKGLLFLFVKLPGYFWRSLLIYIPFKTLALVGWLDVAINAVFFIIIALQVIHIANVVLLSLIPDHLTDGDDKGIQTTNNVLQIFIKVVVRILVGLLVLINLGVEVTPLLAGLGIGGIAVAFALQNLLSDLFASVSLFVERPFDVGDFVVLGEHGGTVNKITLKSTYLTDISGKEVVIPNQNVTNSRLENIGRMTFRRKRFSLGVIYETSPALLKKIPGIIEDVIKCHKEAEFERSYLTDLNAYSIDFLTSYKLEDPAYQFSLQIHENIVYDIVDAFAKHGIEFAYPTQVLHTNITEKK